MMNESTGGVSKRSLLLLGAFTALAMNRDLRRNLIEGTRDAVNTAQDTLDSTVKPALSSAALHTGETLGHWREEAGQTLGTLREEAPGRAQSLLGTVQEVASTLAAAAATRASQAREEAGAAAEEAAKQARKGYKEAQKTYGPRLNALSEDLRDAAEERRHEAKKALRGARVSGAQLLGGLTEKASSLAEAAADNLSEQREDIEYRVRRARRQAEKELRRSRKNWNEDKLRKAVDRRVSSLQKDANRQLALLERQARRDERDSGGSGLGGVAGALLVAGAGTVVLARMPGVRQSLVDVVGSLNPEAADKLHGVGQSIRGVVGDFWLERPGADAGSSAEKGEGYAKAKPASGSSSAVSSFTKQKDAGSETSGPEMLKKAADKNGSPTTNS